MVSFYPSLDLPANLLPRPLGDCRLRIWLLPGRPDSANRARYLCKSRGLTDFRAAKPPTPFGSRMGKNILGGEPGNIQPHPFGKKAKTGRSQLFPALAHEHGVQPFLERVQIDDIGGSV